MNSAWRVGRSRNNRGRLSSCAVVVATLAAGILIIAETRAQTVRAGNVEGIWRFSTLTPLERPARFAGKSFLTESEAVAFAAERRTDTNFDRRGDTPDADLRGPGVNDFWFEAGSLAIVDGRALTSLIVDPVDGRIPSLNTDCKRYESQLLTDRR